MPFKLRITADTVSLIRGLHPKLKRKIRAALQEITNDPYTTGKALKEELKCLRSFRIKRIRIIYKITGKTYIDIIAIGPRKDIYQETYKLISQV